MPEIQCAVYGTNHVHGKLSTNRPADYIFKYITNLCIKTKIVTEKNTQQVNNVNVFMVNNITESEDFMAYGYMRLVQR